jgi:glycine cleavage system aminomethyltransferase T
MPESAQPLSAIELLRQPSLTSLVQREIERKILAGELAPGAKLNEAEIAAELRVSRGPVREAILHDGRVIDAVTSGGFGHTVGKSIAYGFIPVNLAKEVQFEIEGFGQRHPALRSERAPYAPERRRILA